jgi:thioredoxin reductase
MTTSVLDVIIIGGSYAGLSAAMALGRSRRQVLVIDSGKPCNRQTPHSHNFITHDGATPAAIAALAKEQVLQYPSITFLTDTATHAAQQEDQFIITTASGQQYRGDKLLFATGLKDNMPAIPGFAACWGISVLHCPYCHGYEVREEKTGILAQGDGAFEMVKLILNWTADLTVFTNGPANFTPEQEAQLTAHQVRVITKPITHFQQEKGQIQEVVFEDGSRESITAMYARPPFTQHSDLPALLGCNIDEMGFITVDEFQQTNVPGIYAAGDNTTRLRAVSAAIGGGGKAGAFINHALIQERF